jgi:hypothetical protein
VNLFLDPSRTVTSSKSLLNMLSSSYKKKKIQYLLVMTAFTVVAVSIVSFEFQYYVF